MALKEKLCYQNELQKSAYSLNLFTILLIALVGTIISLYQLISINWVIDATFTAITSIITFPIGFLVVLLLIWKLIMTMKMPKCE